MNNIGTKDKILGIIAALIITLPIVVPAMLSGEIKEKKEKISQYETTIEEYEEKIYDLENELEETKTKMLNYEEENFRLKTDNDELWDRLDELYIKHGYYSEKHENAGTGVPIN